MKKYAVVRIILWFTVLVVLIATFAALMKGDFNMFGSFSFGSGYKYDNAEAYSVGNAEISDTDISSLNINWISGKVQVSTYDGDKIIIREKDGLDDEYKLRYLVQDGELKIKYKKSSKNIFNLFERINSSVIRKKELEVILPVGMNETNISIKIKSVSSYVTLSSLTISDLDVNTVSGGINLNNFVVSEAEIDSVSGNISINNVQCERFEVDGVSSSVNANQFHVSNMIKLDFVSGNITLNGEFDKIEGTGVSGKWNIASSVCPSSVYIDSVSGNITLGIPENDGFTVTKSGLSKNVSSDFPTTGDDKSMVYKDGGARFSFNSVSGNVNIYKIVN